MNKIILDIDPGGEWLHRLALQVNDTAGAGKAVKKGRFHFPSTFGKGFAAAIPVEPGLSLSAIRLRRKQPFSLCYEKLPGSELFHCRYDVHDGETGAFVTHSANLSFTRTFESTLFCHQLTITMTPGWMADNLGLLATPGGRIMEAYGAGTTWFSYLDQDRRARDLLNRLTAPSLKSVIYKGMVLELLSFSWSRLTLQKRPNTYADKIA
ncbi:hypothetical protein [Chitinophaga sp. XS-30]|uniref:hypothetical protein n=1 Tax=Chitinophaga sp. XS-30 TaxID=2604421 RepID=UPI0011DCE324|nr:hypothetical protein [Chitinophaga sp. XS-30]QEH42364.1 hypothetical protein FW415_16400 [Chitinophaga sp. XS-30]